MAEETQKGNDRLAVIWSSGDREVAFSMVFMYTKNSKLRGYYDQVRLVLWGPSAKLIAEDEELQDELEKLKEAGVELKACKVCTDMHGVTEKVTALGFDAILMGAPLTEMLKTGWKVLTF